ncbi:hypothetical protein ACQPZ8_20365 [Actinomadura nitritigenes]|uniref:hypothetical protein n=1 Tax=Actinomadura nitritigenes TaxID=134602 RepID=UPI003D8B6891
MTRAAARAPGVEPHAGAFAAVPVGRLVEVTGELPGIDPRIETHTDPLIGLSPFSTVLVGQPAEAVVAGDRADVGLLAGTNTKAGNLYLAPFGTLSTSTAADADATAARSHPRPVPARRGLPQG